MGTSIWKYFKADQREDIFQKSPASFLREVRGDWKPDFR
jgi:hypothetical protein